MPRIKSDSGEEAMA
jgi:phage terminase large subunit